MAATPSGSPVDLCPTGCGRRLPAWKVTCAPCWREVPAHLKREVYAAWRDRQRALDVGGETYTKAAARHEDAKAAAIGSVR